MRIFKVALAFFLIGFLAGSLDATASLGGLDEPRALQRRHIEASIIRALTAPSPSAAIGPEALALELREQAVALPPEVLMGAMAALGEPPEELRVKPAVRSLLFLPQEPDWWSDRHGKGPPRLVTFGPPRPLSEPSASPFSPLPPPMSLLPEDPPQRKANRGAEEGREVPRPEFILPFERGRVTSLFHQGRYHPAIDLAGRLGSPVHATTRRQRVTFTGWRRGYGYTVITRDASGRTHLYAHLQRVTTRVGSVLDQGETLGLLGSTGRSTGPHVHYEVRTPAGRHINPVTLLFPGRRVGRGFAWNGSHSVVRFAARSQPLPR